MRSETMLQKQVKAYERGLIIRALRDARGNRSEAARKLGVDRATLYRKIRRLGVVQAEYAEAQAQMSIGIALGPGESPESVLAAVKREATARLQETCAVCGGDRAACGHFVGGGAL